MSFGIWELGIIMVIVALLFGTRKLGSIGSDMGNAIKGFRNAIKEDEPATEKDVASGEVIEGEVEGGRKRKPAKS